MTRLSDGHLVLLDTRDGRKLHINAGFSHGVCGAYCGESITRFEDEVDFGDICKRCLSREPSSRQSIGDNDG